MTTGTNTSTIIDAYEQKEGLWMRCDGENRN